MEGKTMKLEEVNKLTKEAVDFLVQHWWPVTVKSSPHTSQQWRNFTRTASYVVSNIGSFMSSAGLCELGLARLLPVPMNTG
jgi:hypothetical protein